MAAAVALVVQLFAWAWMPAWSASAHGGATGLTAICTPEGVKMVVLDGDGLAPGIQPSPSPSTGEKPPVEKAEGHCPLCPLVGGLGLAPAPWIGMPADAARHGPTALPGSQIATGWFLATLQARAPPSLG